MHVTPGSSHSSGVQTSFATRPRIGGASVFDMDAAFDSFVDVSNPAAQVRSVTAVSHDTAGTARFFFLVGLVIVLVTVVFGYRWLAFYS